MSQAKNQHYISQAEQKMNSCSGPGASKPKIYRLHVVDREAEPPKLVPAKRTVRTELSCLDLFTFQRTNQNDRTSLEKLFWGYENSLTRHTARLLELAGAASVSDIKDPLVNLLGAKLMSLFRNPFCVGLTMDALGPLLPRASDAMRARVDRVIAGDRRHARAVCRKFGFSPEVYGRWLGLLFLALSRTRSGQPNPFELIVKALLETNYVSVHLFEYTPDAAENVAVLSDRSFSWARAQKDPSLLSFNLTSRAFLCLAVATEAMVDPEGRFPVAAKTLARDRVVRLSYQRDNLEALSAYNVRTIGQCHEAVYSASPSPLIGAL